MLKIILMKICCQKIPGQLVWDEVKMTFIFFRRRLADNFFIIMITIWPDVGWNDEIKNALASPQWTLQPIHSLSCEWWWYHYVLYLKVLHHKRLQNTRLEQRRRDATEKRNNNQFFSELKHFIFLHKAKHIETNFYPSLKCQNFQFSMFLYGFIGKFCNKLQLRCDDDIDQFVWMLRERLAGLMKILIDIDIEW